MAEWGGGGGAGALGQGAKGGCLRNFCHDSTASKPRKIQSQKKLGRYLSVPACTHDGQADLAVLEVPVKAEDPQLRPGSLADQVQRRQLRVLKPTSGNGICSRGDGNKEQRVEYNAAYNRG